MVVSIWFQYIHIDVYIFCLLRFLGFVANGNLCSRACALVCGNGFALLDIIIYSRLVNRVVFIVRAGCVLKSIIGFVRLVPPPQSVSALW